MRDADPLRTEIIWVKEENQLMKTVDVTEPSASSELVIRWLRVCRKFDKEFVLYAYSTLLIFESF